MEPTSHPSLPPLRAPREHRAVLAMPALTRFGDLLEANRASLPGAKVDFLGRSLAELRTLARSEATAAAHNFMTALGLPIPKISCSTGLILCGHQPDLFHPGVWIKNFAIHGLAMRHGLTPVHVIINGDVAKTTAVRVPVQASEGRWQKAGVGVEGVSFDRWGGAIPFEELAVRDEEVFERFPGEVEKRMAGWDFRPSVRKLWTHMGDLSKRTSNLGERLAGARRWWEEDWDCRNLEVPMSRLCQTEAFAWFARHLLAELPRFQKVYNQCLRDYRRRHRIRSRNHPVPDLHCQENWLETPFWVWPVGGTQRERLFAHRIGNSIELSFSGRCFARISLNPTGDAARPWQQLELQGFKIRTRATTTTLFLRLFLADAFIHGIGGAIYDELTDDIIRQFYGVEPPSFLVLSGTLLLPVGRIPHPSHEPGRAAASSYRQRLRDLWFHPDRHLPAADDRVAELVRQKNDWIGRHPTEPAEKRKQYEAIHQLNEQLRPFLRGKQEQLEREWAAEEQEHQSVQILQNREYAFCLHPEEELRAFCRQLIA